MSESAEDYIKTIYILKRRKGCVHSVDVANELGYSKASISVAMANLRKKDIIVMRKNGEIEFTKEGEKAALDIIEKHTTLSSFLQAVAGVDENTANKDACRMEHIVSRSTFDGIKRYIKEHPELVAPDLYRKRAVGCDLA